MTGQHGHRRPVIRATGGRPSRLSRRVDNGMGNDRTEDGTAWADVQAIQLLLFAEHLFPMWMGRNVSNCIMEVSRG